MLSSYIFVTSAIISALVMTNILRDVIQLYSDINFTDVSEERAAFNFTAEVLRVE